MLRRLRKTIDDRAPALVFAFVLATATGAAPEAADAQERDGSTAEGDARDGDRRAERRRTDRRPRRERSRSRRGRPTVATDEAPAADEGVSGEAGGDGSSPADDGGAGGAADDAGTGESELRDLASDDAAAAEEPAHAPSAGGLRRSDVMEFDPRLIRGETAAGAVILFSRSERTLARLSKLRRDFLRPTIEEVLGASAPRREAEPAAIAADRASPAAQPSAAPAPDGRDEAGAADEQDHATNGNGRRRRARRR